MLPSPRIFRSPYGPKWGPGRLATSTTGYHHRHCTAMQPCCHATATEPDQGTFSFALVTMLVTTYLSYWTLTTYVGLFLNSLHPPLLPWRTKQLPNKMIKTIWILFLVTVTVSQIEDDNFFCRTKENAWSLCRRCTTIDEKCPQDPEGCHCENIQIADPEQDGKMIGGSDCNEGFCYISKYNMQKT